MEFNKPVSNPFLVGAIKLIQENPTDENRKTFWDEVMRSEFLTPIYLDPEPRKGENGSMRILPDTNMRFPTLVATDGQEYLAAYTDQDEFDKWKTESQVYKVSMTFDDYINMLLYKKENVENDTAGFVINPFSSNIIVTKDMVAKLILLRK